MPLDVQIISDGATYYLRNSSGSPTPGGDPTAAATTPYSINGATWTQTAAQADVVYRGSPPFALGAEPIYRGYGNVTETVEIGIAASSGLNAAFLIQTLRKILNTAVWGTPATLVFRTNGDSYGVQYAIFSADVQEVGDWQNPTAGFSQVVCRVTWVRSPFGYGTSQGSQNIALTNATSGNTTTIVNYGVATITGDLLKSIGNPLVVSLRINGVTGGMISYGLRAMIAAIHGRDISTTAAGTASTSSTSGAVLFTTDVTPDVALTYQAVRLRLCARYTVMAANLETRLTLVTASAYPQTLWQSSWQRAPIASFDIGRPTNVLVDYGSVDLRSFAQSNPLYSLNVPLRARLEFRSVDGISGSVTFAEMESIRAYSWLVTDSYAPYQEGGRVVVNPYMYRPTVPAVSPGVFLRSGDNLSLIGALPWRGTLPRAYSGALLWFASGWVSTNQGRNVLGAMNPAGGGTGSQPSEVTYRMYNLFHTLRGES